MPTQVRKRRRLDLSDENDDLIVSEGKDSEADSASGRGVESSTMREHRLQESKILSKNDISDSRAAVAKTGVIYLSRIPPRLSPTKIRQLLSPYGCPILRIFLAPESSATHSRRVKSGGSGKKQYIEGWVEFEDKGVAKKVATMLNAQRIATKKGDFLYDDLWCMKYLPKFKWHHLTEQIGLAYQNASRAEKFRNEIAQEKRETVAFMKNTERSKMIENMQRKKLSRSTGTHDPDKSQIRRHINQKSVVEKTRPLSTSQGSNILKRVFD